MTNTERRRDSRFSLQRRVKLMCTLTGRCYSGRTEDYSAGGAMLVLDGPSQLAQGQRIRLGVDWTGRQGVIKSDAMPQASVVRSLTLAGRRHLAVAFDQRQALAASA